MAIFNKGKNDKELSDAIERGQRIRNIRENELRLNKSELAGKLGIAPQYLGLVESGKGNLAYKSIRKICELTGYSSDYILFGLDDNLIEETRGLLKNYTYEEILFAIESLKKIAKILKNKENETKSFM